MVAVVVFGLEEAVAVTFFFGLAIPRDTDNCLRQDLANMGSIRQSTSDYISISLGVHFFLRLGIIENVIKDISDN